MPGEYSVHEFGPLADWGNFEGGLSPQTTAPGRRFVEKDLPLEFFGVSVNSRQPGTGADYWHSHAVLEELYFFVDGEGEMALDDKVIPVKAGTAVRVGQGVMRTWRAKPESPTPLKWLCVRGGGASLKSIGRDGTISREIPFPWPQKNA